MMKWTKAQMEAITVRGETLLVSAGAGSGKTAVLTQRILGLLQEGISIDRLLVVTFTKAAAAEMRERIMKALYEAGVAGDAALAKQALRVERASITTLHGFCSRICKEHFQAAEIDPMYRVLDETEAIILRERAALDAMLQCYENPSPFFAYAAECLTQQQIQTAMQTLYDFLMGRPDPWAWLQKAIAQQQCDRASFGESVWVREIVAEAEKEIQKAQALYAEMAKEATLYPKFEKFAMTEEARCHALLALLQEDIEGFSGADEKSARKPVKTKDVDETFDEWFKAQNTTAREMIKKAKGSMLWLSATDRRMEEMDAATDMLAGISEALVRFESIYKALKLEKNLVDYHDLEHCCLKALQHQEIAKAIQKQFDYIFVDEYQDSSLLQEEILQSICKEGALFMVGDVKQSIYRFRQAEPSLFLQKMEAYRKGIAGYRNIPLNENFRSHPVLLACINDIFERVFSGGDMEITYDDQAKLVSGRTHEWKGAPVEVHILQKEKKGRKNESEENLPDHEESEEEALEAIGYEAQIIAKKIVELRNAEEGGYRLRDMAILLRVIRGKANHIVEVLRKNGIPAKMDIGEDTLQQIEVQDLLSILKVVDNFYLDLPLMAALQGPALGLREQEIARIRIAHPEDSFADAVVAYCEKEDALAQALRGFRETIEGWGMEARVCPLDRMIRKIYYDTGAFAMAGVMPEGKLRQDHLLLLAEAAASFQAKERGGLGGFLRYIDKLQTKEGIESSDLGDQEDVVRIMSIHKSKGLQFPVVFVAGLGSAFTFHESRDPVQMHATLGIGMQAILPALRIRQDTVVQRAIILRKKKEMIAEQARLLYVALTRAEARLLLIGTHASPETETDKPPELAAHALDWILPSIGNPERWRLYIHHQENMANATIQQHETLAEMIEAIRKMPPPFPGGEVARALDWEIPQHIEMPLKQSVTARAKAHLLEKQSPPFAAAPMRPLFMEEKGLTGTERGNAVHAFLRAVPLGTKDFDGSCQALLARGILIEEEVRALPKEKLRAFLQSELWARVAASEEVHREWGFNLREEREGVIGLLQGILDCCFMEAGEWVLVDYKTDRADEEILRQRHQEQICMYAQALRDITGIPVREKILYAISIPKEIRI